MNERCSRPNTTNRQSLIPIFVVANLCLAVLLSSAGAAVITLQIDFPGVLGAAHPESGVIKASDGNFYGTTVGGGTSGVGTIFKIDPAGHLTTIYSFLDPMSGAPGAFPRGKLVEGSDSNFYGTTEYTTASSQKGVIFKVTPAGIYTVLHSLRTADGISPEAGLILGSDGNFYGVAITGGAGYGTVFKVTPNGSFKVLHKFSGSDGSAPYGELVQGTDGNFYGTTGFGGDFDYGTVFQIKPDETFTSLHSFDGGNEGRQPSAAMIQTSNGDFYGTAAYGGRFYRGTIFKITASGALTILHSFAANGGLPNFDPLLEGSDGNFYGATTSWGTSSNGIVYQLKPGGKFTVIYNFSGPDGSFPETPLIQDDTGELIGTTFGGGSAGWGTLFRMTTSP